MEMEVTKSMKQEVYHINGNRFNELLNPCINCNESISIGKGSNCDSFCKAWLVYKCAKQREEEMKVDSKSSFYKDLDKLHMNFYDMYSRKNGEVSFEETSLIREIFEFIKNKLKE